MSKSSFSVATSAERQSFYRFVYSDVEEAKKEHFLNGRVLLRSSLLPLFESLEIPEGFKCTANTVSYLETLSPLIQTKLLRSDGTQLEVTGLEIADYV